MPIPSLDHENLKNIIGKNFTPSKEIEDASRLFGREEAIRKIDRAMNSAGRHIFIFGDRGVGKTSVAKTAARQHNFHDEFPIYVACGRNMTFGDVMLAAANSVIDPSDRFATQSSSRSGGLNIAGVGGSLSTTTGSLTPLPKPINVAEALDLLKFVDSRRTGQTVIVIDEFDAVQDEPSKELFAELVKNASTATPEIRFVFCGIGASIDEILGSHPSADRYFEAVELEVLRHDHLWQIIRVVADETCVEIDSDFEMRISIISDGFPHFVHLLGECLFYAMNDDPEQVTRCERHHFEEAVAVALDRTEPRLRKSYQTATHKTKNKLDYEEALWALADTSETRRQLSTVYDGSYIRIMRDRSGRAPLDKQKFNNGLLRLREPGHGSILISHGSGWYSFRENVMRGYVRLQAQHQGVILKPET